MDGRDGGSPTSPVGPVVPMGGWGRSPASDSGAEETTLMAAPAVRDSGAARPVGKEERSLSLSLRRLVIATD